MTPANRANTVLHPDTQALVIDRVFEAAAYFDVLVLGIDFTPIANRPGMWDVTLELQAAMNFGEVRAKTAQVLLRPTGQGLLEATAWIMKFVGDWTG